MHTTDALLFFLYISYYRLNLYQIKIRDIQFITFTDIAFTFAKKMYDTLINELLHTGTRLVAVSKTKPASAVTDLYDKGQRIFGENYVQELTEKHEQLPTDIQWHFTGHLQSNKVKYIAPFVDTIQGVDSPKLAQEINKQAEKNNRTINCLLQFHISDETTKFGFTLPEAQEMLNSNAPESFKNIKWCGVMGMATFTDNKEQVRREFQSLKLIFDTLKNSFFPTSPDFKDISMGMSDDYKIAVEEGATIVRIGSLLFGKR